MIETQRKYEFTTKYIPENVKDEMLTLYKSGIDGTKLTKIFSISPYCFYELLRKNNIPFNSRKRECDYRFFQTPNELNSYWAGFLLADGHVNPSASNLMQLLVAIIDKEHLSSFADDLHLASGIWIPKTRINCSVRLHDSSVLEDLIKFGVHKEKTGKFIAPTIEDKFLPAFIRGWIDGDGNIYTKTRVRGKNSWLQVSASVVGNTDAMLWLQDKLINTFNFKNKIGMYHRYKNEKLSLSVLSVHSLEGIIQLADIVKYKDTPRLDRKWNKIDTIKEYMRGKQ